MCFLAASSTEISVITFNNAIFEEPFGNNSVLSESRNSFSELTDEDEINRTLQEFGLYRVKDHEVSQISDGEKKRLSIAIELIGANKPDILFVDEPTTGLDSTKGMEVSLF